MTPSGHKGIHFFILLVCILTNVIFFLVRPDYFGLFIAASFYLNMFYFFFTSYPDKLPERQSPGSGPLTVPRMVKRDRGNLRHNPLYPVIYQCTLLKQQDPVAGNRADILY